MVVNSELLGTAAALTDLIGPFLRELPQVFPIKLFGQRTQVRLLADRTDSNIHQKLFLNAQHNLLLCHYIDILLAGYVYISLALLSAVARLDYGVTCGGPITAGLPESY